jgi:hypothetical protein
VAVFDAQVAALEARAGGQASGATVY